MDTTLVACTAIGCGTAATITALAMGHDGIMLAGLLSFISSIASGAIAYTIGKITRGAREIPPSDPV